jgi:serpin B
LKTLSRAAEVGAEDAPDGPVLAVANTLWAHEELPLERSYVQGLADWPGSAVRNAPFRSAPEDARRLINADIAETTRDLIPELLPPDSVDSDTVAALVNALYLKTSWTQAFAESSTVPKPFHAPTVTHDVATMHVTRSLGYAARDGWQAVTLPAAGGVEAMVLLPDADLASSEHALDPAKLDRLLTSGSQERIRLSMPKFEVTGDAELQRGLVALGARTLFTPRADFSRLTTAPLTVSAIAHQAVLRVDENGLEGAAATAAMMRLTAVLQEPEPIRVDVDRPFLFLVRHRDTGALYFWARVVDPA